MFDIQVLWRGYGVRVMIFNATFNNISALSPRSVLLVEETGVFGKKTHHTLDDENKDICIKRQRAIGNVIVGNIFCHYSLTENYFKTNNMKR